MAAKSATSAATAAAENKKSPVSATDILNSISLEAIDAELADLESQKDELQKQIDSLKACRKVIDIRINGKQKRGWSPEQRQKAVEARAAKKAAKSQPAASVAPAENGSAEPGSLTELATVNKIARCLLRSQPAKPLGLAQTLGMSSPEVLRLLKKYNDRFVIDPIDDRWSIRPAM